jgi:hypothetical protein
VEALERGETAPGGAVPVWVRERPGTSWASLAGFLALCLASGLIGFRAVRSVLRERRLALSPAGAEGDPGARGERETRPGEGRLEVGGGLRASGGGQITPLSSLAQAEPRLKVHDMVNAQIGNGIRVHGRVLHEGGGPAEEVRVEVRAYDSSGGLVASQQITPEGGDKMVRGQSAHFEAYFENGERIVRVEARVTWSY